MPADASQITEAIQEELEKQLFHLRNLGDISRELYRSAGFQTVLKDFLLMSMGSFGAKCAFVLIRSETDSARDHFQERGLTDEDAAAVLDAGNGFLANWNGRLSVAETSPDQHVTLYSCGIAVLVPLQIDPDVSGLLGLGIKLSEQPYTLQDKELVEILGRNLALALRNFRSLKTIHLLNQTLTEQNSRMEAVLEDLDRKVYHLKTLFEVSKKIFGSVRVSEILRRFLLLTVGTFGAYRAFVLLVEAPFTRIAHIESYGYLDDMLAKREEHMLKTLVDWFQNAQSLEETYEIMPPDDLLGTELGLPFCVEDGYIGMLGLGPKLIEGGYSQGDKELLETLVNNLVPALGNARAFENIQNLNLGLQETNRKLKETLESLRSALRKVEILEGVKSNLAKFVPVAVTRMIESSPSTDALLARERDVSVLFLDIEGYAGLCEHLQPAAANQLIEKYFSVFMDAIYENHGDVNETAGDGLMVLFLGEDETANAFDAIKTAFSIRERTLSVGKKITDMHESVVVNMGISSGPAYVGAAKFESFTGSRWTYTARGMTTNLAARICEHASSGQILLCRETADRVRARLSCRSLGRFALKNISEKIEIFSVEED